MSNKFEKDELTKTVIDRNFDEPINTVNYLNDAQSDLNDAKIKILESMDTLSEIKQKNLSYFLDNLVSQIIEVMQEIDLRKFELSDNLGDKDQ